MYYSRDEEFDKIKPKIQNKASLVRHDDKPYSNGNVRVYIPNQNDF
jgi:hypothetical protein